MLFQSTYLSKYLCTYQPTYPFNQPSGPIYQKVHGVLRNLKLEAPLTADNNSITGAEIETAVGNAEAGQRTPPPSFSEVSGAATSKCLVGEYSPAGFGRLGSRNGDGDSDGATTASGSTGGAGSSTEDERDGGSLKTKQKPSPPPPFSWFSFYDEQGVGARRNHTRRTLDKKKVGEGGAGAPSLARGVGVATAAVGSTSLRSKEDLAADNSDKSSSWRWMLGRRGRSDTATATTSPVTTGQLKTETRTPVTTNAGNIKKAPPPANTAALTFGTDGRGVYSPEKVKNYNRDGVWGRVHDNGELTHQLQAEMAVEVTGKVAPSTAEKISAPRGPKGVRRGRRGLADAKREGRRRKRKDVYSYFIMPLVRALEAQTGTTVWLRKVWWGCFFFCFKCFSPPPPLLSASFLATRH